MHIYSILASAFTAISFVLFIGIIVWAYNGGRKEAFQRAANEPFALPDETDGIQGSKDMGARR